MKKIIVQILLFVIIFNYIFNSFLEYRVYAADSSPIAGNPEYSVSYEDVQQVEEDGTTPGKDGVPTDVDAADTQSTAAAIMGNLISLISGFFMAITQIIKFTAETFGYIDLDGNVSTKFLTIQNIVFGNYYMLNANVFKDSTSINVTDKNGNAITGNNGIDIIKESVSKWYYILKLISLILGMLTLIYIGIRMAMSTVATEQAKYKKMLLAWVQSIALIIVLPYIMRGLNYLNEILLDFAKTVRNALITSGGESFESYILENIHKKLNECGGTELVAYSIGYLVLIFAQFKFFFMYVKRVLSVSFLTVIAPLITITYSIDKAGDGKAQAFSAWIQEYAVNMLIQPLQAFLYLIFIFSANEIAKSAPIVGIIFLLSLTRAEKIVKTIFNLRNMVSIHTMKLFNKGN